MLGTLPVGRLHLHVVPRRLGDPRLEVVDHHPPGDTPEMLEGVPVELQPGRHALIEDELHVLIAAPGQRHHEGPGAAQLARLGIDHAPRVAEVHLRLLARLALHPHRRLWARRRQVVQEAVDRGQAAAVAPLPQSLPDRRPLDPLRVQLADHVPVRFERRDHLRRGRRVARLGQQLL